MGHLGHDDAEHMELTTGYRVPQAIIDLANRVLPHLGVTVASARSLRSDGKLDVTHTEDVVTAAAETVEHALNHDGHVGVIAADNVLDAVRATLPASERVELVPSTITKGLEFDHVILVEPADIAMAVSDGEARPDIGLRHLYVALTRAVSKLTIVHTRPLPTELNGTSVTPVRN